MVGGTKFSSENTALIFNWIFFILAGNEDNYKSLDEFKFEAWMSLNLGRIPPLTSELAALERLKKRHIILLAL